MAYQIQLRRDTAGNWTSTDPTLAVGEFGYETDTTKFKIGDGSTAWTSLGYLAIQGDGDLLVPDSYKLYLGTGSDGEIYSSSDDLYIRNVTQDKDIIFSINDGGSQTTVMTINGDAANVGIGGGAMGGTLLTLLKAADADLIYLLQDRSTIDSEQSIFKFLKTPPNTGNYTQTHDAEALGAVEFYGVNTSNVLRLATKIAVVQNGTHANGLPADCIFYTNPSAASNTGVERFRITNTGILSTGGETAPDASAGGLTLNQGAADTAILTLKSSDIATGGIVTADTDTWAALTKNDGAGGGLLVEAATDANATNAVALLCAGLSKNNLDTTKSTAGRSCVEMYIAQHDGAGSQTNVVADGNCFGVRAVKGGSGTTIFIVDEDGDIHTDTGAVASMDADDDIRLAQAFTGKQVDQRYHKRLQELGVINEHGFQSRKKTDALTFGTLGQLWNAIKQLGQKLGVSEDELLTMARSY